MSRDRDESLAVEAVSRALARQPRDLLAAYDRELARAAEAQRQRQAAAWLPV